jgi:hypothetical protein
MKNKRKGECSFKNFKMGFKCYALWYLLFSIGASEILSRPSKWKDIQSIVTYKTPRCKAILKKFKLQEKGSKFPYL